MKNFFNLKLFLSLFVLFIIQKMKPLYTFFYSCSQTRSLWSKLQELLNSEILLPQNTPGSTFLVFQIIKKILKSLTICILYLSIICMKAGIQEK